MITLLSSVSLFLLVLLAFVFFAGSRARKENSVLRRRLEAAQSGDWTSSENARAAAVVERTRALAEQGRTTVRTLSERMERVLISVTAVRGNGERLSAEARGLSEAVDSIAGAFVEISANTGSLADLIVRQATAVEQSSAAVTQMSASARSMAESVEARKAAHERLSAATKAGATTAAATGEVIAAFADRAGKMAESISVIDSIASSTNLLAMNAAIEAAHAGQYGKGFAVVADEIRKLASDTSERAGEVSALLSSLNDAIAKAREAGAETTRVFVEIESIAAETVDSFAELASGIGELAQGTHEVSQSTGTLADITEQIKTGAREVADATSSINEGLQRSGGAAKNSARETADLERSLIELNLGLLALSDLNAKNGSGTDAIVGELASLRTGKSGDALVAGALDFKTVRLRHKEWVSKIRLVFADALELRSEEAASPRACMLGKWLYEGGGVERIAGRAGAADLERVHDGIHRLVADILREKGKLSREGLDARVAELERGSEELVGILDRLERDLAAVV